jgi:hypothetical protein
MKSPTRFVEDFAVGLFFARPALGAARNPGEPVTAERSEESW